MSLLDNARKPVAEAAHVEVPATEEVAPKKKNNSSDYQKRRREHQYKAACTVRDFIKSKGIELPADVKSELDFLCKEKQAGSSAFGTPVIYKLFGNTPKKGDKITALKVFEETGKGFSEMRSHIKKWSEQGIVVKFDEASKSYIVDSDIPAYNA